MNKNLKKVPKMVQLHYDQMINTLNLLEASKFATLIIPPVLKEAKNKEFKISWDNQCINEGVNASNFSFSSAFETVLSNRSFQALLFDNSILRCSFEFKDDVLITQNFSWIPCPLIFEDSFEDSLDFEPLYISERILEKNYNKENILLRSTVRFDYDSGNNTSDHPSAHMHLQNPETRIDINEPVCFNSFVKHIIETYYPQSYYVKKNLVPKGVYESLQLHDWKGLSFKTASSKKINRKNNHLSANSYSFERLVMG